MTKALLDEPTIRAGIARRFWAKVQKTSTCWLWTAFRNAQGYGRLYAGGRTRPATHVALWLATGKWPPQGMLACHRCDNPSCVNPDHLFLGTARDNARDCLEKGRDVNPWGERNGSTKLTEEKVRAILAAPGTQRSIAAKYGVDQRVIWEIRNHKIWRHVTEAANV